MAAAMAKPSSFVRATLMPAAAAARSLARTARKRRPVAPRRKPATPSATITVTMTAKTVNRQ